MDPANPLNKLIQAKKTKLDEIGTEAKIGRD